MPAGPSSLLRDASEEERRPRTRPWMSPWSLDDEWNDEPPQPEAGVRVVAAARVKAGSEKAAPSAQALAAAPTVSAIQAAPPVTVAAKAANGIGTRAVIAPAPVAVAMPESRKEAAPVTSGPAAPSEPIRNPAQTGAEPPRRKAAGRKKEPAVRQLHFSWAGPIVASLGLLGLTFLAWVYWQDPPLTTDEDLRVHLPPDPALTISAPRRMRAFLESVGNHPGGAVAETSPWEWSTPVLSEYVVSQGPAFDNLRDLLEDYDWHPRHSDWYPTDLGAHPAWARVALLLKAQAAYLVRRGDEESAFTTAIDLAEFGRRLQDLWAWPSFAARSLEMHMACVETLAELLKRTRLESGRLAPFQREFADCAPSRAVLQDALSAYYLHEKKLLLGRASGEPAEMMPYRLAEGRQGRLLFKMNQTLNLFGRSFRELKAEVAAPPGTAFAFAAESARRTRQTAPHFYQPNAAGERYFSNRIDLYLNLPEQMTLAEAKHGLVLCLFAIRRHVADHQGPPQGLTVLKPRYLAAVPIDPFSGEAPHYDPLKGRIYSVGTNRVDEGGIVTQPPLGEPREPTAEVGIAPAAVIK